MYGTVLYGLTVVLFKVRLVLQELKVLMVLMELMELKVQLELKVPKVLQV